MRVAGEVPRSETVNFNACRILVLCYSKYVLENRLETYQRGIHEFNHSQS